MLSWKWDDWIGAILAELDADMSEDARAILDKYLPIAWESANISTAPDIVQKLDRHLGGLRPTQFLFSSDPSTDNFVFCAWWPWGSRTKISLRIGILGKDVSKEEDENLTMKIRAWAGI
jgi:hypothetical protein